MQKIKICRSFVVHPVRHLAHDVGGQQKVVGQTTLDHVRPGRPRESGGHLGREVEAAAGGHLVRDGPEQARQEDVKPVDENLLTRLGQRGQRAGLWLTALKALQCDVSTLANLEITA